MATRPLTSEAIALTEKKMDMSLDDIIKMSKAKTTKPKKQRVSNKNGKFISNASLDKSAKFKKFVDTRSFLRQGALARKRSNFQGNQFPLTTEASRMAAAVPVRPRAFNRKNTFNVNKPRVGINNVQNIANGSGFVVKKSVQPANVMHKQRPQTLDSLFANMKERRMREISNQNNGQKRTRGGQQAAPWVRGQPYY